MPRAFSLIETMVALGLGGVIAANVVVTFSAAINTQGRGKREWAAFTIAQQNLELLAALPNDSEFLLANDSSLTPGARSDLTCTGIPLGVQHFRTNGLGDKLATGQFDVCYKITSANPIGGLRNVRVVVLYEFGGQSGVLLQTVR